MANNRGGTHEQHVKAGQQSHKNDQNRDAMSEDKPRHRGGSGNFAEDPERAAEAGRKGGKA
ncbi:hypothetical protein DOI34_24630 [Salmonella enterica subsp. enterica serovar Virchow]|nr:hypothetical protein [Salmonella enterica subsp. enterica serovar Virchow]EFG8200059.1 hypothetical protein [Escherichia coli]